MLESPTIGKIPCLAKPARKQQNMRFCSRMNVQVTRDSVNRIKNIIYDFKETSRQVKTEPKQSL